MGIVCRGIGLFLLVVVVVLRIAIGKYLSVQNFADEGVQYDASHHVAQLDENDHNTFVFVHVSLLSIQYFFMAFAVSC